MEIKRTNRKFRSTKCGHGCSGTLQKDNKQIRVPGSLHDLLKMSPLYSKVKSEVCVCVCVCEKV